MNYDVIIVGGGPAGLFAAYELITQKPELKVCLIDKGKSSKTRERSDVMCGIGGGGLFSDGKLHFTPVLSHEKLLEFYDEEEYQIFLDYVDQIFTRFGVDSDYYPKDMEKVNELVARTKKEGINLIVRKLRHVGSDKLPKVMQKFEMYLEEKGVKIYTDLQVDQIITENNEIKGVKTVKGDLLAKYVLVAPGRIGALWIRDEAKRLGLEFSFQSIWVGVRVEFPSQIMEEFSKTMYESIFKLQSDHFDDTVRTFCPCPNGYVSKEEYDDFVFVNGHSNSHIKSDNSNFALVTKVKLTEPVSNTISYGEAIGRIANLIGGNKPILQRFRDLKNGRRSTWYRIKKSYVTPTFKDVTPGDLSMIFPARVMRNLIEGLEKLDKVMPGIASDSTLLYGPEIKFRSAKIETDKHLESKIKNLYFAGDGAGLSGNIVGAAANGIIAAKGILNKYPSKTL
ncbi:MAG: FAD-dependent protein [Nanoarchaeota archaeon]